MGLSRCCSSLALIVSWLVALRLVGYSLDVVNRRQRREDRHYCPYFCTKFHNWQQLNVNEILLKSYYHITFNRFPINCVVCQKYSWIFCCLEKPQRSFDWRRTREIIQWILFFFFNFLFYPPCLPFLLSLLLIFFSFLYLFLFFSLSWVYSSYTAFIFFSVVSFFLAFLSFPLFIFVYCLQSSFPYFSSFSSFF